MSTMSTSEPTLPPDLVLAVAERRGRIALVIGAGCSLEYPTDLKLSSFYSADVHRRLLEEGVLQPGDCPKPEDRRAQVVTATPGP